MSRKRQDELDRLLEAGDQAAYEARLEEQRNRRNGRMAARRERAAVRAEEDALERLIDDLE